MFSRSAIARIIEHKFHAPLRPQPRNTFTCFLVGYQHAVRVGSAAANLGHLRVGQVRVAHVFDIIEQSGGGGILLGSRQLFDLAHGLFEQFCHAPYLACRAEKITTARGGSQRPTFLTGP